LGHKFRRLITTFREVRSSDQDVLAGIRFFDALSEIVGRGEKTMIRLMESTPHGRETLRERRSLFGVVTDRDWLRGLPDETLGREYIRFADEKEIYPEQFEALLTEALGRSSAETDHGSSMGHFVHDRYRHLHDVWHVALGYDTDEEGELGILACTGRQNGYRAHYLAAFVQAWAAGMRGDPERLKVFWAGWRRARRVECLLVQDWKSLLEEPLEGVRVRLKLNPIPTR
jgi:ubiquinone biosynthesis protein COQ4